MLRAQLMPHQKKCLEKITSIHESQSNGVVLSLAWGSGKTLISIEAARAIRNTSREHHTTPILVICEVSTVEDWGKNMSDHYSPGLSWMHVSSKAHAATSASRMSWYAMQMQDVIVTNVEIMVHFHKVVCAARNKLINDVLDSPTESQSRKQHLREFMATKGQYMSNIIPDMELAQKEMCFVTTDARHALFYTQWPVVIIDEVHKIRNSDSTWYSALSQLRSDFRISLTATPFNNNIEDVLSILSVTGIVPKSRLASRQFDNSLEEWSDVHKDAATFCCDFMHARDTYIIQDTNVLVDREHYRPTDIILRVPFDHSEERRHYDLINTHGTEHILKTAVRLKQACSGIFEKEGVSSLTDFPKVDHLIPTKIRAVLEYLTVTVARNEKVNILCEYRSSLVMLKQHIQKKFQRSVEIYTVHGETSTTERCRIRLAYERCRGAAVLIVTSVFNQGVNLQCANHTIHFSTQWNPVIPDQGRSRCERPAQTRSVFSVQIVIENTIEDQIWLIASEKRKMSRDVMYGTMTPRLLEHVDDYDEKSTKFDHHFDANTTSLQICDAMQQHCSHFITNIESIGTLIPKTILLHPKTTSTHASHKRIVRVESVSGRVVKFRSQ